MIARLWRGAAGNRADAEAYVRALADERRYLRDVY